MNYFTYPQALWLLLVLPALGLLSLWSSFRKRRSLARLGNLLSLQRNATTQPWRTWLRRALVALALLLLVLGSAGPRWGRDVAETVGGRDIVVVLDLSRSMLAEPKSRQERAVAALLNLCDAVEKRGGHRLGLVVFAAHAEMVCPLTHDYDHFRFVLKELADNKLFPKVYPDSSGDISGTRIGAALTLAVQLHSPTAEGAQDILLISDGDDPARDDEWRQGVAAANGLRLHVDAVGVGDPELAWPIPTATGYLHHDGQLVTTKLEEEPLKKIAAQTGGAYIALRTKSLPLGKLYHEVLANRERQRDNGDTAVLVQRQRYAWFLGPALGMLALTMVLGDRRSMGTRK